MNYFIKTTFLILAQLIIGCGSNNEKTIMKHQIMAVKIEKFASTIAKSSISDEDKKFIIQNIDFDRVGYKYISIRIYLKNNQEILEIDRFNYDEWTHSVTGEKGKSQHGSMDEFNKVDDEWQGTVSMEYGG